MSDNKINFVRAAKDELGAIAKRADILRFAQRHGVAVPHWLVNNAKYRHDRGVVSLQIAEEDLLGLPVPVKDMGVGAIPAPEGTEATTVAVVPSKVVKMPKPVKPEVETAFDISIPPKDKNYVKFGFHNDLKAIVKSEMFFPVFISGLSGNGKTTMVEQVCAELGREVYRVNVSVETDEDALVGGPTLINGDVVFREGPAIVAMRKGAILLLDEVDRGSNKLICLQSILEGKPFLNKKTGELITPAKGFNIVATANTKGRGSEDGRFSAAQFLDDAFLERFAINIEQEYPGVLQETKILMNTMKSLGIEITEQVQDFQVALIQWVQAIRKTYEEGGISDQVSTRRLVRIAEAYSMFKNEEKAITMCVARFEDDTKQAIIDLYKKIRKPLTDAPAEEKKIEKDILDDDVEF